RTGRDGHAYQINGNEQTFTFNIAKRHIRDVGQAVLSIAIKLDISNTPRYLLFEIVAKRFRMLVLTLQMQFCQFGGAPESYNRWDILSSSAAIPLVVAAGKLRTDPNTFANVESSYSFRSMNFVPRQREQIDTERFN